MNPRFQIRPVPWAWAAYLTAGLALVAAYFAVPLGPNARAVLDVVFPLANVIAIVVGIRWFRPDRVRPFVLFAIGMSFFVVYNVVRSIRILFFDGDVGAAPAQDIFQSVGYVVVIAALISLIYSREGRGARDRSSLIDASIIVVGAAMLAWVFVLAPFAHDSSIPIADRLFKMLYPVANLILLAVSVRLAVSRGARSPALFLLLVAMVASLVGNTLALDTIESISYLPPDDPINIAFFLAYLFAGAGPLHPSMSTLTQVGQRESRLSRDRIALFLGASMTGIAAYFIERARGEEVDVPVILIGSLLIFLLVLVRLAGLSTDMRRSEERFRSLIQNASDAFAILEPDGTVRYVSPAAERVLGFSPEELTGQNCFELAHPDDRASVTLFFGDVLGSPGEVHEILVRARSKESGWVWLQLSAKNLLSDPAVLGVVANFHDVTAESEAQDALRRSERNSRLLFESSPIPMWVYDRQSLVFLAVNDAAIAHYGYSRNEFLSMNITEIRPPEEMIRLLEDLEQDRPDLQSSGQWIHKTRDGHLIDVEVLSHTIEYEGRSAALVVTQDVTERNRVAKEKDALERQLRQSQKLEAVGQLAGGVAHDFNNLLAVISNYSRFVRDDLPEGASSREDMDQVLNAAEKAARLVRQLLAFSRREIVKPEIVDLNDVVSDIHKMLRRTIKESINLVVDLTEDLWSTQVDRGQLEQVLLNLAVNADAAMPDGGTLEIRTSNRMVDEDAAAQKAELTAGSYVCLTVSDDGVGMPEEVSAHVFEPFFTTKAVGEGTGLGLSTVYGIVKQAGGYVYVYSEPGRGTTFNLYLPATDVVAIDSKPSVIEPDAHGGNESILVVEDEAGVRSIAKRILEGVGYEVVLAETPAEALEIGAEQQIDLLLTDVIMPGLSGRELAGRLQSKRPSMKVVFMSGYTDEIIARQGVLDEGVTFLQKPFGAEDLLPLVREVLSKPQESLVPRSPGVLIVDDEEPMRDVLRLLLESSNYRIVGEACSGEEAIDMAAELRPELVVLDHLMPGMNGAQAAIRLRTASPESKICAFSAVLTDRPVWADAFLTKERIGELPPVLDGLAS